MVDFYFSQKLFYKIKWMCRSLSPGRTPLSFMAVPAFTHGPGAVSTWSELPGSTAGARGFKWMLSVICGLFAKNLHINVQYFIFSCPSCALLLPSLHYGYFSFGRFPLTRVWRARSNRSIRPVPGPRSKASSNS